MICPNCGHELTCYIIGRPDAWENDREYVCKACGLIAWTNPRYDYEDPVPYMDQDMGFRGIRDIYRDRLKEIRDGWQSDT